MYIVNQIRLKIFPDGLMDDIASKNMSCSTDLHFEPTLSYRFIAGSARCSTKPLSILLTKLLTHIKQGLQKYCETAYSRSGVNQMWILKNSKELLEHLKSPNFNHITSIKSFDFSTLYTTIPHEKLKSRLASIIRNSFMFKTVIADTNIYFWVTKNHTL